MTLSDGADGASKVVNVIVGMPSVDPIVHSCTVGALLIALLVSELACFLTWAFQETAERNCHYSCKEDESEGSPCPK
jgi:hypothetical protein